LTEIILTIEGVDPVELYGEKNVKLNLVRKAFPDLKLTSRGNSIKLSGTSADTQRAKNRIELMVNMLKEHNELSIQMVEDMLNGNNPLATRLSNGPSNTTLLHGRDGLRCSIS